MKAHSARNFTGIFNKHIFIAFAGLTLAANGAVAQDTDALIKRKYEILQQEADASTARAEAQKMRAASELRRNESVNNNKLDSSSHFSAGNSQTYFVPAGIDALAGTTSATFRMGTGVVLRVSGDFRPDPPTTCIAYCPAYR